MSTKAQVQADVKAIAARRADGMHIDQKSLRFEKEKERKIEAWRNEHVKPSYKQGGYTLVELLILLGALISAAIMGGIIYALVHFIAKLW